MRDQPAAAARLHPSRSVQEGSDSPHLAVEAFTGDISVGIGEDDVLAPLASNLGLVDVVKDLGARSTVDIFEGAGHGFAVPGPGYLPAAAERSYEQVLSLFDRTLKGGPPEPCPDFSWDLWYYNRRQAAVEKGWPNG
ncbi:dienelactone hydrolase family protein [Prauserella sp. PE36]|uniref:dienelactone hydrolase family protein n=1 Tax=Prauserella sp. PE36 TaxID=1504709 RepID=UPI0021060852|nr:dienelactone hydrolase family protein [Prauserella sp. PE36]